MTGRSAMWSTAAIVLAVMCWTMPSPASGLSCWQCNSERSQFCKDVPAGPVSNSSQLPSCLQEMYKECPPNGDLPAFTFCRKNEQTIQGQKRVIRACGFEKSEHDCYVTKTPSVTTRVCQCFEDGCNAAPRSVSWSASMTVFAVVIALVVSRATSAQY